MKPLVIYHANCPDGFGAAFAAWLKLGDDAVYLPMAYGATYNFDLSGVVIDHVGHEINGREVFILGFSFPREVMDDIFTHAKRVVWLDHHKTAFEMYGLANSHRAYALDVLNRTTSPHYILLDNNKSGALLAWEYFHPGKEIPRLIQHIDAAANHAVISERLDRLEAAEGGLETERMRLAACGVAALGYFEGCAEEYTSASLDDVLNLRKRLEAAEKERDWHAERCEDAMNECAALRNKIEAMEKQEPVAYLPLSSARILESGVIANAVVWNCRDKAASDMPLYALPGAQPAPSVPDDIVREVLRDCCGTFHGSRHRITCEKYKGKRDQETSREDE